MFHGNDLPPMGKSTYPAAKRTATMAPERKELFQTRKGLERHGPQESPSRASVFLAYRKGKATTLRAKRR